MKYEKIEKGDSQGHFILRPFASPCPQDSANLRLSPRPNHVPVVFAEEIRFRFRSCMGRIDML